MARFNPPVACGLPEACISIGKDYGVQYHSLLAILEFVYKELRSKKVEGIGIPSMPSMDALMELLIQKLEQTSVPHGSLLVVHAAWLLNANWRSAPAIDRRERHGCDVFQSYSEPEIIEMEKRFVAAGTEWVKDGEVTVGSVVEVLDRVGFSRRQLPMSERVWSKSVVISRTYNTGNPTLDDLKAQTLAYLASLQETACVPALTLPAGDSMHSVVSGAISQMTIEGGTED